MASTRASSAAAHLSPTRRRWIVDAATRLFAAARYDAVQIDDVACAAGVAKPTLYRYFATKEDLFLEAFDALLGEVADELAAIVETGGGATQALPEMIGILLERLGGNHSGVRLFDRVDKRFAPHARSRLRARTRQIRGSLAAIVRRGVEQEEFREVDPDFVALAVIGSLRMIATRIPSRRRAGTAQAVADVLLGGISIHGAQDTLAPALQDLAPIDVLGVT